MPGASLRDRLLQTASGQRLRSVKRAFEPAHISRDRMDMKHLRAVLAAVLRPDSNCVDVGAHSGAVLHELVRLAPEGRHHAFEPLPEMAASLTARFPAVVVRELALSDSPGTRDFVRVVDNPGWSGFVQRPGPADRTVERLEVKTARLDDALPTDLRVDLLKVDVEGAELEVLRGGQATLERCRPTVVLEHGLGSADFYGTSPDDVYELLVGVGLRLFTLAGEGPLDAAAFEAVFRAGSAVNFIAHP